MFIMKKVCKKKTINPTLFKKKGANAPSKNKNYLFCTRDKTFFGL